MSVGLGVWIVLVSIGVRFGLELGIGVFWIGVLVLLGVGVSFAEIPRVALVLMVKICCVCLLGGLVDR